MWLERETGVEEIIIIEREEGEWWWEIKCWIARLVACVFVLSFASILNIRRILRYYSCLVDRLSLIFHQCYYPDKNYSKLFHRLQKMESVSRLVAYSERVGEEAFSAHAKKRAQRMMHYSVSFRPFTATIQAGGGGSNGGKKKSSSGRMKHSVSFERSVCGGGGASTDNYHGGDGDGDNGSVSSESLNSSGSIFMRTPTSFPPTPTSRLYYFERGSQVSVDA